MTKPPHVKFKEGAGYFKNLNRVRNAELCQALDIHIKFCKVGSCKYSHSCNIFKKAGGE